MVRFGIAGFGLHGRKRLLPAFQTTSRARLSAISQRDASRARSTAAEIGVPIAFGSVDELCASPEVDAVFIATPNFAHLENVLAAITARKAVLCEKPMALNASEALRMVEAARDRGLLLGIAQVFRFQPLLRRMRDLIAASEIGTPVAARADFCFPGHTHARTWLRDARAGGGIMADVGVHCLDALRFALADEPVEVAASMRFAEGDGAGADTTASAWLRFRRGTLATVSVSMESPYYTHIEVGGDAGRVIAPYGFEVSPAARMELHREGKFAGGETFDNTRCYAAMIDAFAASLEDGAPFDAPGVEGWQNQRILDAAYESARTGRAVTLDGESSRSSPTVAP